MQEACRSEACHKNALQSDLSVTSTRMMSHEVMHMHMHMPFRGNLAQFDLTQLIQTLTQL